MFEVWTKFHDRSASSPESSTASSLENNTAGDRDTVVVIVRGELDIATAPTLSDLLSAHVSDGVTDIRLHTGDLTFCDAAGLGVLAFIDERLAAQGGALRLLDAPPLLRRLLEITDLESLLAGPPCRVGGAASQAEHDAGVEEVNQ